MKDNEKTREQLVYELAELRSQNAALKKSESPEKYRSVFDNSIMGISQTLRDGRLIAVNNAYAKMYGYANAEEMMTKVSSVEPLYANPEEREDFLRILSEKGVMEPREITVVRRDGAQFTVLVGTREVRDFKGNLLYYQAEQIDITKRKRVENALRESEELFRSYLENAPDAIYTSDLKGNFLYGNCKCEEIIGYRREELIGKSFLELNILPEKSLNKAAHLLQANIEGKSTGPDEIELLSKDGRVIPVEINTSLVQRMGQPIVLGFVRDITDRKRTKEALRGSEEKYHWVLDNMADVITVMDMNLRFTYVSPSIMHMRGYTAEEAMAQTFEQVMTPESLQMSVKVFEEEMKLEVGGTADPSRIRILEVEQYRKDGSIVLMENHLSFLRDEAQKPVGIISVSHDITERRRVEGALKESEKKYRLLADNVNDVLFVLDMNLKYIYISPSVKILRGYEPADVLKQQPSEILAPSSLDLAMSTLSEIMELEKQNSLDRQAYKTLELNESGRPREECGIFAIYGHEEASRLTFFGLFALQHRGQESADIVSSDGCQVWDHKGMGLASEVFKEPTLQKLPGQLAIGHVRYSTTGSSVLSNAQPFLVHFADEYYALAHNGNIINAQQLRQELENSGSIFQSTMDSEIIIHLMAPHLKDGLEKALVAALSRVEGAYSIIMLTRNKIIAARDPRGFRPLALGKLNGSWVVASETCAFDLVAARYIRDVNPGEILIIDESGCKSLQPFPGVKPCHCIFELIYFARPDSQIFGQNVYLCRKRLGHELAREYIPNVDIVMPFPDSGNYAALGYAEESGIAFEMGMIRNHYVGRTFIQPTQPMRDFGVRVKLNPVRPLLAGKKVLIVEDSIIRGTTSRNRVQNLRGIGVKEIHMVISCPPTTHPCPYGIDFSSKGELLAAKKGNEKAIADFIGLDSLHYLTVEGMVRATGMSADCFCLACYTGDYPLTPPEAINKFCLEQK